MGTFSPELHHPKKFPTISQSLYLCSFHIMLFARLRRHLIQQRQQNRYRTRISLTRPQAAITQINNQEIYNFSSNDYLGFANHPTIIQALQKGATRWGVGAGAAHLVSGHTQVHEDLERALAQLTKRPRALLFNTGYMANLAVLSSLLEKGDTLMHDRLNHASLIDGGLLANCRFMRYQHVNMSHLSQRLTKAKGNILIASDGVFSMDGNIAPLNELATISQQHQATLMIDDAHGFGVLGAQGAGSLEKAQLNVEKVPILMGTLGKALGTTGAFIAGSEELIEYLIQFARPYIYTTALSPAMATASLSALELLDKDAWRRHYLTELILYFKKQAQQRGLPLLPSCTPIQPIIIGDNTRTMWLAKQLQNKGILVGAIRPPTVPKNSARLRITLSAAHQYEHIDLLLNTLALLWTQNP